MKELIQRPDTASNSYESGKENSRQASASDILQSYKNRLLGNDAIMQPKSVNNSNVYQFNLPRYSQSLRKNFNSALGDAKVNYGEDNVDGINIDISLEQLTSIMDNWQMIPGVAPKAGNHIFNSLGFSLGDFYEKVFTNIKDDDTYKGIKNNYDIDIVNYENFVGLTKLFEELRDSRILRFDGRLNSNNHVTYGLYLSIYLYKWQDCVSNALYGNFDENYPVFDVKQAIDQQAYDKQIEKCKINDEEINVFDNEYYECNKKLVNMINFFEDIMVELCRYIDEIVRDSQS